MFKSHFSGWPRPFFALYRAANFFGVVVVLDHAVDVVGQLAIVADVLDAAGVHHVANALYGAVLARKCVA